MHLDAFEIVLEDKRRYEKYLAPLRDGIIYCRGLQNTWCFDVDRYAWFVVEISMPY